MDREASLGLPVATSNRVLVWHALRVLELRRGSQGLDGCLTYKRGR